MGFSGGAPIEPRRAPRPLPAASSVDRATYTPPRPAVWRPPRAPFPTCRRSGCRSDATTSPTSRRTRAARRARPRTRWVQTRTQPGTTSCSGGAPTCSPRRTRPRTWSSSAPVSSSRVASERAATRTSATPTRSPSWLSRASLPSQPWIGSRVVAMARPRLAPPACSAWRARRRMALPTSTPNSHGEATPPIPVPTA